MARARNIKPGFFSNDTLAELAPLTRILFAGLWSVADREGRLEDRPNKIKAEVLPYDKANVDKMLDDLQASGFVLRYVSGGLKYLQVLAFSKHQNPHKNEAPSTLPAPEQHSTSTVLIPTKDGTTPADSLIPDSLNLIPSPGIQCRVDPPPAEKPEPQGNPAAGAMAAGLRLKGVSVTSQHPTLLAWIADGFSLPSALEAVEVARLTKPVPEPIAANYLDRILRNPPKKSEPAWWSSDQRILAKGRELNINPRPGEEMSQFKERIQTAMGARKEAA